jgi:type III pantothenate kinase
VHKYTLGDIAICSVVPKLTAALLHDLKTLTGKTPQIIGKDLMIPIKNYYQNPKQLGQDRLINAFAVMKIYCGPAIIIDSGSTITFDILSKKNTYLGGLIFPGLNALLKNLNDKTAQLPLIKLTKPNSLIGTNTKDCILSGVIFGTAALTKELIDKLKNQLGKNTSVIGTGGSIALLKKYSGIKIKIDENLTLKGINFTYASKH